jgi:hypothetical protein
MQKTLERNKVGQNIICREELKAERRGRKEGLNISFNFWFWFKICGFVLRFLWLVEWYGSFLIQCRHPDSSYFLCPGK